MKASLAESYRSIPLFGDPHDEPLKLSDEYLSICRKFDEARIICGYPVPTPAGTSAAPSFGPDWEQRAREHCRSIDVLLAANVQRQKRIDALEAENAILREGACAAAERAFANRRQRRDEASANRDHYRTIRVDDSGDISVSPTTSDILSSAMRGDRPLDRYAR